MEYKEEGNAFFKDKQWAKAIEKYSAGLNEENLPADLRGLLLANRCQCRIQLSEWQGALDDANDCLKLLPSHAKCLYRRGTALEKLGKTTDALADYVKVVKLEPQNKAAIEAAQRLRVEVMQADQTRRHEVLPAHLIEVLKSEDNDADAVEKKIDACSKLRGLCVHKSMTKSLIQYGVVETFAGMAMSETTHCDVRGAVLGVLMIMASDYEAEDHDEAATKAMALKSGDKPLVVSPAAADVRVRLRSLIGLVEIRKLCVKHPKSMQHLCNIIGNTREPEEVEALGVLHDGLMSLSEEEGCDVPRAAVMALLKMCDTRRRMGKLGQPVMPTDQLLKCIESALGSSVDPKLLRAMMASVFTLLADDDRPKEKEVDVPEVAQRILEPFLSARDFELKANGLCALSALFEAHTASATKLLGQTATPLTVMLTVLADPPHGSQGLQAQEDAANCLLISTGDLKTRKQLVECGGIDMMLKSLEDESGKGLMRAKVVGVLAMLAGHSTECREEVFDRCDFLMELRFALDAVRDCIRASRAGEKGALSIVEARRLCKGLYESCACLTIHGEFKETLFGAKKTLKSMQSLVSAEDITEDPDIGFFYVSMIYNLCCSRDDKVRPKRKEYPFNELGDEELNEIEKLYEKLPEEARPQKNGEIDAGSPQLASQFRSWCVTQSGDSGQAPLGGDRKAASGSSVVSHLAKCAGCGSIRVRKLVAIVFKHLCASQEHRAHVVSGGGVRALLGLVDLEDDVARDAARQSLAQICIVTNPSLFQYNDQLDMVRPLAQTMEHKHELLQFEGAMGLTNLLTVGDELRSRAIQAEVWRISRDLLFSDNEMCQRAGLEVMCNLTMSPEIVEKFVDGKCALEIKILCAFSLSEDVPSQVAATGALAMLTQYEEVSKHVAAGENYGNLLQLLTETSDGHVQHRLVATLSNICEENEGVSDDIRNQTKKALRDRLNGLGFASPQAKAMAKAVLEID